MTTISQSPSAGFVGWIPTIVGRLSFGALARWCNTLRAKHFSVEFTDAGMVHRYIAAHHLRVTNDGFWSQIVRALFKWLPFRWWLYLSPRPPFLAYPPPDAFDHFFVGSAICPENDEHESIKGTVYVLHTKKLSGARRREWKTCFAKAVRAFEQGALNEGAGCILAMRELIFEVNALVGHAATLPTQDVLVVPVVIDRTGRVTIDQPIIPQSQIPPGQARAPIWKAEASSLAAIAFRFLRDLFHAHYHHHGGNEDGITRVVSASRGDAWWQDTERRIFRSVMSQRRLQTDLGFARAEGRLAYLAALHALCKRLQIQPELPHRDFEALRYSITAASSAFSADRGYRRVWASALFGIPVAAIGFIAALIQATQADSGALYEWFLSLYHLASDHLITTFAVITVVIGAYLNIAFVNAFDIPLFREVFRASATYVFRSNKSGSVIGRVWVGLSTALGLLGLAVAIFALLWQLADSRKQPSQDHTLKGPSATPANAAQNERAPAPSAAPVEAVKPTSDPATAPTPTQTTPNAATTSPTPSQPSPEPPAPPSP